MIKIETDTICAAITYLLPGMTGQTIIASFYPFIHHYEPDLNRFVTKFWHHLSKDLPEEVLKLPDCPPLHGTAMPKLQPPHVQHPAEHRQIPCEFHRLA